VTSAPTSVALVADLLLEQLGQQSRLHEFGRYPALTAVLLAGWRGRGVRRGGMGAMVFAMVTY
jgi:hypothetical protein